MIYQVNLAELVVFRLFVLLARVPIVYMTVQKGGECAMWPV